MTQPFRTLIYRRTHEGDPNPDTGVFGSGDCMGSVRGKEFDAVIGIGGIGREPKEEGIAGKLTWIGIGREVISHTDRGPQLTFRHFLHLGKGGPDLLTAYPALARHMYKKNVRLRIHSPSPSAPQDSEIAARDREVSEILRLARDAPPSNGPSGQGKSSRKCTVPTNRSCR